MRGVFDKNRLDLAYKRQLTHLNIALILGTLGLLSFIGTFIWNRDYLWEGLFFTTIILLISLFWYRKIDESLKTISNKIKNL